MIVWHGLVDQLIFTQGTTDYYERVKDELGGREKTERFARLFLAPVSLTVRVAPDHSPTIRSTPSSSGSSAARRRTP